MEREILFITFSQQGSCQNQIKLRCDNGWRKIRLLFNLKKKKKKKVKRDTILVSISIFQISRSLE